jgi:hypothetical protein
MKDVVCIKFPAVVVNHTILREAYEVCFPIINLIPIPPIHIPPDPPWKHLTINGRPIEIAPEIEALGGLMSLRTTKGLSDRFSERINSLIATVTEDIKAKMPDGATFHVPGIGESA